MTIQDDVTIYTAIEHLSLEETARLVIAHQDARGMAISPDDAPAAVADTVPLPASTTAPARQTERMTP